jgi:hypothetical protein
MLRFAASSLAALAAALMLGAAPLCAGWTADGAPVCTADGEQYFIQICPDGAGGAIIVWADYRIFGADIYAQRLNEDGDPQWTENGVQVCTTENSQFRPTIVSDGAGGALIAYVDFRDQMQYDITVQRIDADGNRLWGDDGMYVCTASNDQEWQSICSNGAGGCIVAWIDDRTSDYGDVYAQRIEATGTASWTADGVAICTADSIQTDVQIVSDGLGGAIIVWLDYREDGDLYGQSVNGAGTLLWTAGGELLIQSTAITYDPRLATDDYNGTYITWFERRGPDFDILVQRINSSGAGIFIPGGVVVCDAFSTQRNPAITADGNHGAIICWEDNRDGELDLYAQMVNADGTLGWTAGGEAICLDTEGIIWDARAIADGAGGAIIAWADDREMSTNDWDVYVQRVSPAGATLWDPDGTPLCTVTGSQAAVAVTDDNAGGAIVAWRDQRNPDYDVYAQRITANGTIVATMLQGFSVNASDGRVSIMWRLAEAGIGMSFFVSRRDIASTRFVEIEDPHIERDGLSFTFTDTSYEPGTAYRYRIEVADEDGRRVLFETEPVTAPEAALLLSQNHPNPFNPATTIRYSVPVRCRVHLAVYDVSGRLVVCLVDGMKNGGPHTITWNGMDTSGTAMPSGIYLYRLTARKRSVSRKMVLLQ